RISPGLCIEYLFECGEQRSQAEHSRNRVALAMAGKVRDHQLKVTLQFVRDFVPRSCLIAPPMQQHKQRPGAAVPNDLFSYRGRKPCYPEAGSAKPVAPEPDHH